MSVSLTHLPPAIIQIFYSSWEAVGNSGGIAAENIGTIVQIIDIPSDEGVILQDLLLAVQSVCALIPGPSGIYAAHSAFSFTWEAFFMSYPMRRIPYPISDDFSFPSTFQTQNSFN